MGHSTVSYLSKLRRRLRLRIHSITWMELRQHDFPLLVVNKDHLVFGIFVLLLIFLLLFLSSILCISTIELLLVGLPLSYFSILSLKRYSPAFNKQKI